MTDAKGTEANGSNTTIPEDPKDQLTARLIYDWKVKVLKVALKLTDPPKVDS